MLNKDGYSHEIVTDEDGRTWLKPAVTIVYNVPALDIDQAELMKHFSDDFMSELHPRRRRRWFRRSHD